MWPHELKLERARHHLRALNAEIDRWTDDGGYELTVDPEPHAPHFAIRARILRDVDADGRLPLLVGDFLQNARAALDYIAFALGDAGAGGAMDDRTAGNSAFPIIGDVDREGYSGRGPDLFADAASRNLATVDEPAREAIERLQPYYVGGRAWDMHPLWILHELARYDRHRFLQLVAVQTGDLELDPGRSRNVRISNIDVDRGTFFPDWDESGAEIPTTIARVTAFPASARRDIELHFKEALRVGFDLDSLPSTLAHMDDAPIGHTMTMIEMAVRHALAAVVPFLPATPSR